MTTKARTEAKTENKARHKPDHVSLTIAEWNAIKEQNNMILTLLSAASDSPSTTQRDSPNTTRRKRKASVSKQSDSDVDGGIVSMIEDMSSSNPVSPRPNKNDSDDDDASMATIEPEFDAVEMLIYVYSPLVIFTHDDFLQTTKMV